MLLRSEKIIRKNEYFKVNGTDLRGDRAEPKHGKKVSQAGFD